MINGSVWNIVKGNILLNSILSSLNTSLVVLPYGTPDNVRWSRGLSMSKLYGTETAYTDKRSAHKQ